MHLRCDDTYWPLFTDLSLRRSGFTPRPVRMGFVVDSDTGTAFSPSILPFSVTFIALFFYNLSDT